MSRVLRPTKASSTKFRATGICLVVLVLACFIFMALVSPPGFIISPPQQITPTTLTKPTAAPIVSTQNNLKPEASPQNSNKPTPGLHSSSIHRIEGLGDNLEQIEAPAKLEISLLEEDESSEVEDTLKSSKTPLSRDATSLDRITEIIEEGENAERREKASANNMPDAEDAGSKADENQMQREQKSGEPSNGFSKVLSAELQTNPVTEDSEDFRELPPLAILSESNANSVSQPQAENNPEDSSIDENSNEDLNEDSKEQATKESTPKASNHRLPKNENDLSNLMNAIAEENIALEETLLLQGKDDQAIDSKDLEEKVRLGYEDNEAIENNIALESTASTDVANANLALEDTLLLQVDQSEVSSKEVPELVGLLAGASLEVENKEKRVQKPASHFVERPKTMPKLADGDGGGDVEVEGDGSVGGSDVGGVDDGGVDVSGNGGDTDGGVVDVSGVNGGGGDGNDGIDVDTDAVGSFDRTGVGAGGNIVDASNGIDGNHTDAGGVIDGKSGDGVVVDGTDADDAVVVGGGNVGGDDDNGGVFNADGGAIKGDIGIVDGYGGVVDANDVVDDGIDGVVNGVSDDDEGDTFTGESELAVPSTEAEVVTESDRNKETLNSGTKQFGSVEQTNGDKTTTTNLGNSEQRSEDLDWSQNPFPRKPKVNEVEDVGSGWWEEEDDVEQEEANEGRDVELGKDGELGEVGGVEAKRIGKGAAVNGKGSEARAVVVSNEDANRKTGVGNTEKRDERSAMDLAADEARAQYAKRKKRHSEFDSAEAIHRELSLEAALNAAGHTLDEHKEGQAGGGGGYGRLKKRTLSAGESQLFWLAKEEERKVKEIHVQLKMLEGTEDRASSAKRRAALEDALKDAEDKVDALKEGMRSQDSVLATLRNHTISSMKTDGDSQQVQGGQCGGAPKSMLPSGNNTSVRRLVAAGRSHHHRHHHLLRHRRLLTVNPLGRRRRRLQGETSRHPMVPMTNVGCLEKTWNILHENPGGGASKQVKRPEVKPEEANLAKCLRDFRECQRAGVKEAALALPSIRLLRKMQNITSELPRGMNATKRFKTCALVGNGNGVLQRQFGPFINMHQAVVRFNFASFKKFEINVGTKTTHWVAGHLPTKQLCCKGEHSGKLTSRSSAESALLLWFPAAKQEILNACRKRFPRNPGYAMHRALIDQLVQTVRALRADLQRLGLGPFGTWYQLTSGAHGVLLFSRICDSMSLYGFSSYTTKGPDQYNGRVKKVHSGQVFHDWDMEAAIWRLLNAAGIVDLCTI